MTFSETLRWNSSNKYLLRLSSISVVIYFLDQLTKAWVRDYLSVISRKEVIGDLLQFTLAYNEGGAFSTKLGSTIFYTITSIAVLIFVLTFLYKDAGKNRLLDFSLALVIGGALGNLTDRFRFGSVVDWIDVDFPDIHLLGYDMTRWPVFNVADSAITVAMTLILLALILDWRKRKHADNTPSS